MPDSWQALLKSAGRGTSYEQLALDFAIPIGTVRSRLNRARNRIEWHRQKVAIDAAIDAKEAGVTATPNEARAALGLAPLTHTNGSK